jgi:hypothetical protein
MEGGSIVGKSWIKHKVIEKKGVQAGFRFEDGEQSLGSGALSWPPRDLELMAAAQNRGSGAVPFRRATGGPIWPGSTNLSSL